MENHVSTSNYPLTPHKCHCGIDLFGGKSSTDNIDAYLIFHLKLRASNLLVAPYTEYQQFLYETITKHFEMGWNYKQSADWLSENKYTTSRVNMFRDVRLNRSYELICKKIFHYSYQKSISIKYKSSVK